MKKTRTARSVYNAAWSLAYQMVHIASQLVMQTALVRTMGIAYTGLSGLFAEVIGVLSLAEMGVGPAIVYCLYAPLATGDEEAVARLMGLYRRAYRAVGFAVLFGGILLAPWIDRIVTRTDFSAEYIRAVFMLFVVRAAGSYFFAYKASLLCADQKNHVVLRVMMCFRALATVLCVAALLLTRRYTLFLLLQAVMSLAENIAVARCADRAYPFLRDRAHPAMAGERARVRRGVRDLFIGRISAGITTSTDQILISLLVSTVQSGVYSSYALILNAVRTVFARISGALAGSIGNLSATADAQKMDETLRRLEFLYGSCAICCSLGLYGVLTPFIGMWIGVRGVLEERTLAVLVFNEFLMIAREPLWSMAMACGLFRVDKIVSVLGSAVNLLVSVLLGRRWGMAGIFLGTSCTLVIQIALKAMLLDRVQLHMGSRRMLRPWVKRCALMLLGMTALHMAYARMPAEGQPMQLVLRGAAAALAGLGLIMLGYGRTSEFSAAVRLLRTALEGRA